MQDFFLGRQPILDRQQQLVGYELLFRSGMHNAASFPDDLSASATVIAHAFGELGMEEALAGREGFINASENLLFSDTLSLLPRRHVVLEILESVVVTPHLVARLRELHAEGYRLAVDDFTGNLAMYEPFLDIIEIVKVDLSGLDDLQLTRTTRELRRFPVRLLAEKVETLAQFKLCAALGYELFQGYYFARPAILKGKKIVSSQMALLQLLELTARDAENHDIEQVLKREPGLTLNLLRMVNSVGVGGGGRHVHTLSEALFVLGRRQLMRWLQLLLFAGDSQASVSDNPLLLLAATRGRAMELLAREAGIGSAEQDQAFMTGVLSLTPALLQVSIQEILRSIKLAPPVHQALEEGVGLLGSLLKLVQCLEDGQICQIASLTSLEFGLTAQQANRCMTEAMAWGGRIGQN